MLARLDDGPQKRGRGVVAAWVRAHAVRRLLELVRRKVIAKVELDRARSDLDAAEAALARRAQRDYDAHGARGRLIIRRDGEIGQFISVDRPRLSVLLRALRVTAEVHTFCGAWDEGVLRDALPDQADGEVSEITPKGDPVTQLSGVIRAEPRNCGRHDGRA